MKKILLVTLALATALATAPLAMADTLSFTATGSSTGPGTATTASNVSATGTLTGTALGGNVFGITAVSGVSITINGIVSGATLVTNNNAFSASGDNNNDFWVSDVVNTTGASGYLPTLPGTGAYSIHTFSGLVFQLTSGTYAGDFVDFYYLTGGDVVDTATPDGSTYVPATGDGYDINFAVTDLSTATPEPSSLLLMGTGLLLVAGFLFRQKALQGVL